MAGKNDCNHVWLVRKQNDMVEGPGGMSIDSVWDGEAEVECAEYMDKHMAANPPQTASKADLARWMCASHAAASPHLRGHCRVSVRARPLTRRAAPRRGARQVRCAQRGERPAGEAAL